MASATEGKMIGDIVHREMSDNHSREVVTIATSQTVVMGSVLMRNASDQFETLAAVADGVKAEAIALEAVTTTTSTATCLALKRNAVVDERMLDWGAGTEADAKQSLEGYGILCIDSLDLQTL